MHRALLLATVVVLALSGIACRGGGDKAGDATPQTPPAEATRTATSTGDGGDAGEHEDELRTTVPLAYKAIFGKGAVDAYAYASDDFKAACPLADFITIIAFARAFIGDLTEDDIEVEVTGVRYEDERAIVAATTRLKGESFTPEEEGDGPTDYWVYEDGGWKYGTDDEDPCSTSFDSGDGFSDGDETPASGPGASRAQPLRLGQSVDAGGLRITVLSANIDAADQLPGLSDFPSTPEPGRRVVLLRVRAEHIGTDADETITLYESDYKITGSNNVLYEAYDDGVSCGFLDDTLEGEMFPGGVLEGYVCFQVPANETDLLLVTEPGFDDANRRFLALE